MKKKKSRSKVRIKSAPKLEVQKPKKPWSGRFSEDTNQLVEKFTSSISFDSRLFDYDIRQSIAYAKALKVVGVFNDKECKKVINVLKDIGTDFKDGKIQISDDLEDIHMNIEMILTDKVGDMGKKLHTGRSRNDQVITDVRMYLKEEICNVVSKAVRLEQSIIDLADKNADIIMAGVTHLQHAQPILFSHHLMAYFEMIERDRQRLKDCLKRVDVLPLGSGALAGSSFPIDREYLAKELGFSSVSKNSIDAVSDRDFVADFIFCSAIIMMHLSRLCEELIFWSSPEFGYIEFSDAFSTGSSIMPQKKNPDVAELIRGKCGRVYGSLISILTILKGQPLSYNRDLQEDKEGLFDSVDTVKTSLQMISEVIRNIKINREVIRASAAKGFTTASDIVDYIVKKGMPFREAHKIVGRIVAYCVAENKNLTDLNVLEFKRFYGKIDDDIFESITLENSLKTKNVIGGTSPRRVREAIKEASERIKK